MTDTIDLDKVARKLKKKFASIRIAADNEDPVDFISTGNKALDLAMEGGIAIGYVSEWSGGSGAGKTLMLQIMAANIQRDFDAVVIWLDRENAWFNKRAEELGIDTHRVILFKPQDIPTVEEAKNCLMATLESLPADCYKFIAIDSISAFDKDGEKSDMGKKAKSIHELFRRVIPLMDDKTSLNFTNQRTFKVGVLFGNPETTTGGEAPKFYATYRIKLDDVKPIVDEHRGNEIIGNWIEALVIKTRLGPNYRKIRFPFYFKEGIPFYGGYFRLLASRNIVKPKNKQEFLQFKRHDVIYKGEVLDEIEDITVIKSDYPELIFDSYPEYIIEEDT